MEINILYIDDQGIDLERYGDYLEEKSTSDLKIRVDRINGGAISNDKHILEGKSPDLILVDFDFSNVDESNNLLGMNGATFSNLLRQKFSEVPIILLTTEEKERRLNFPHSESILACLDDIKYKEQLIPPNETMISFLISLSIGYKKLRNCENRDGKNLLTIISAPAGNVELLKMSYPKDQKQKNSKWNVFEVAKWIRKTLMEYPGILYEDIFAATFLGISIESFNQEPVKRFFFEAKYCGIFSEQKELWWKNKLQELASKNMNESEKKLPLRRAFSKYWERIFGEKLQPSICGYKNDSPADTVCCLLKQPVMLKYSIRYFFDARPDVMDESRISFKAIQTGNDVNFNLFDEIGMDIIKDKQLKPR